MIVDVIAIIDSAPVILRHPWIPFSPTSFRIPVFVEYDPQIGTWPDTPYYNASLWAKVTAILIGGVRYSLDPSPGMEPTIGRFKIHEEPGAAYACIGINPSTLWGYRRIEVIGTTSDQQFSKYGTKEPNGTPNPPLLLNAPTSSVQADALQYQAISFEEINLDFIRERKSIHLYGAWVFLSLRFKEHGNGDTTNQTLGKYVLNQIEYDVTNATIKAIDFRYKANIKYPTETLIDTGPDGDPFLEDEYIGNVRPRAIGWCNGVPGIPLNGKQVFQTGAATPLDWFDFQFPPGWESITKIEVEISGPVNGIQCTGWIEVWPGLGSPNWTNTGSGNVVPPYNPTHPTGTRPRGIDTDIPHPFIPGRTLGPTSGVIQIWWQQAIQNAQRASRPNRVRMFGRWPHSEVSEAIPFLLELGDPVLVDDFMGEFNGNAPIGLYMDSAEHIWHWLEIIQAGNVIGSQLISVDATLKYKQENPNRPRRFTVRPTQVLNHEEIVVELANDFMFSGWDITYNVSHDGVGQGVGHSVGSTGFFPVASVLNGRDLTTRYFRNTATDDGFRMEHLAQRVNIFRNLVEAHRYRITELKTEITRQFMSLQLYDVVGYAPRALEGTTRGGVIDWMVYGRDVDIDGNSITFTLVERAFTDNWGFPTPEQARAQADYDQATWE